VLLCIMQIPLSEGVEAHLLNWRPCQIVLSNFNFLLWSLLCYQCAITLSHLWHSKWLCLQWKAACVSITLYFLFFLLGDNNGWPHLFDNYFGIPSNNLGTKSNACCEYALIFILQSFKLSNSSENLNIVENL